MFGAIVYRCNGIIQKVVVQKKEILVKKIYDYLCTISSVLICMTSSEIIFCRIVYI